MFKGFTGPPISLPWTTASPAFEDAKNSHYSFDLDKAKSLLAQAGVSNLTFDLGYNQAGYSAEYAAWAQIIQSDLATIGVRVNLVPQEGPVFTAGQPGRPAGVPGHAPQRGCLRPTVRGLLRDGRQPHLWDDEQRLRLL